MIILSRGVSRIAKQNKLLLVPLALLLVGLLFGQTNCSTVVRIRKIKLNETFTLQPGETVETEDSRLKVRLKEVGRSISESGEVEYVELQIRFEKSEQSLIIREGDSAAAIVGDFLFELINADSFGKTNCRLKISRKGQFGVEPG